MIFLLFLSPIFMALGGGFLTAAILEFKKTEIETNDIEEDVLSDQNYLEILSVAIFFIEKLINFSLFKNFLIYWKKNPTGRKYTYISVCNIVVTILILNYA